MGLRRLALAGILLALTSRESRAQISPGELSRFHQSLEGARNCAQCHEAGKGVTPRLCLACHKALGQRIAAGAGLHARNGYGACERCHVEHQGRGFELIFWGKEGRTAFDHAQAGFPLQGRHARLACESCHKARSFLGLGGGCASCHKDVHQGQFAPRGCADCHGQDHWKPPAFDHDRSGFPLTGRHEAVACSRCHPAQAAGSLKFAGVSHASCASCHRDAHAGRLGTQCASCHATGGWNRIEQGRFDHARTRFPLTGRHSKVACARCHAEAGGGLRFQGTPFQTCASCHRDPHAGRLGAQCASCHASEAWSRIERGRFDHDRTRYPLRGRHADVECAACHRQGRPLSLPHEACTDCHADHHAGQLARRPDAGRCDSCHDTNGFASPRFSVEDHGRTAYPLTGGHLAVPCDACHRQVSLERLRALGFGRGERLPERTEQLRFASTRCAGCHQDPHRDQTSRLGACETCHQTTAWAAVTFDHARTGFRLDAGHANLPCRSCHPAEGGALGLGGRPTVCGGCHKDPHGGQFARGGKTDCGRCHTATAWSRVQFDHDRETSFPLVGAHRGVPCAGCHRRHTPEGGMVRYSGLGKACTDCHAAPGAQTRGREGR